MKRFHKAAAIALLCGALAPAANAGGYHHGFRHGGHGSFGSARWIAPALAGGLVTYALIQPRVVYAQPPIVTVAPPPTVLGAANPASVYYYCDSARNFYPYTQACPEGWKVLPTTPTH